jgi:uncharacterized membrane protein
MDKKWKDALVIVALILAVVPIFIFTYFADRIWILTTIASTMLVVGLMLALWANYFSDIKPLWLSFLMGFFTFACTIGSLYLLNYFGFQQPQSTIFGVAFAALTARILNKNVTLIKKKFSID